MTLDAAEIEEAREEASPDVDGAPGSVESLGFTEVDKESLTADLLDIAEQSGAYLDEESIDFIPLLDGDVQVAASMNTAIEEITLSLEGDGELSIEAESSSVEGVPTESGPGLAASWTSNGSGEYIIKIKNRVDARFTWARKKLVNDGDSAHTTYGYKRWGDAQPIPLNNLPDPRIKTLRIQSFPYDSVEPHLYKWGKYSPSSDEDTGSCTSTSVGVTVLGAGLSQSTQKCGRYNMWRNVDKPASYWIQYEGNGSGGNRNVAFVMTWVQDNTAGSLHDLNKVVIDFPGWSGISGHTCTQTDASRTCVP